MDKFLQEEIEKLSNKAKPNSPKNLPSIFFFTDQKRIGGKIENIFDVIKNLPQNSAVIVREYNLKPDERLHFAQKIMEIATPKNLPVLIGKDWNLAEKIGANGVHFSDRDQSLIIPKKRGEMILSYSCHSLESIIQAEKLKADLLFYSPIFLSKSHLNQKPIGIDGLKNFTKKTKLPVYALGGIDEKNIELLENTGISGIGGISIFL
jgi:thiamine-phosphate pyrophosphorylase